MLLFLCLIGTIIYLDTNHARHLVQKIINRSIPGTISWADHKFSLLEGKAAFENILLKGPRGDHLVALDNMRFTLSFTDFIGGRITDPVFEIRLKGDHIFSQNIFLGDLAAIFTFAKNKILINQFDICNRPSILAISGSIYETDSETDSLFSNPSLDIHITGGKINAQNFFRDMSGEVSFSGRLTGNAAEPSGYLNVKGNHIETDVQKIRNLDMAIRLEGNKLFLDKGLIKITPEAEIKANGWICLDGKYNFQAVSKGISLSSIDKISDQEWDDAKIVFAFTGTGDIKDPKLTGEIGICGLQVKDKMIDPISLNLDVADMTARISGKEPIKLNMEIQLETLDINGSADFGRIDLHPFFKLAGYEEIFGFLDGRIELAGNIGTIEKVQAQIQISKLETFWKQNELLGASNQAFVLKNGLISLPDIRLTLLKEGYLDLKGQAELNGMIDIKTKARIPLKIIEPFCDDVYDIEGYITCSGSVNGPMEQPIIKADIVLEEIGLGTPFLSERLRDTNGSIHLTPDIAVVKKINGKFNTGKFNLEGTVDLKDYQPLNSRINFTAHAVPVHMPDTMEVVLNTELAMTGNKDKSEVFGKIVILEGVYFRDVDLNLLGLIPRRSRSEEPVTGETGQEFLKNMSFDIAVGYRNPFVVENNISFLELKPDLHIKGKPDRFLLSGRAKVEPGGIIKYQEKEFEVARGIIDFLNPYKIEPTIDLEGKTKVREWTIFLNVSGNSDNLVFNLRSDPPEQNSDILYLLAFGKTVRESANGERGKSTSPAQMIAAMMAGKLEKNLKDSTGLDTFEVEYTTDSHETDSDKVKVMIGKDISRRLSVKYGAETRAGKIVRRTITEYKFMENLLLDAYNDSEGDYGGELKYRLEFR